MYADARMVMNSQALREPNVSSAIAEMPIAIAVIRKAQNSLRYQKG